MSAELGSITRRARCGGSWWGFAQDAPVDLRIGHEPSRLVAIQGLRLVRRVP